MMMKHDNYNDHYQQLLQSYQHQLLVGNITMILIITIILIIVLSIVIFIIIVLIIVIFIIITIILPSDLIVLSNPAIICMRGGQKGRGMQTAGAPSWS